MLVWPRKAITKLYLSIQKRNKIMKKLLALLLFATISLTQTSFSTEKEEISSTKELPSITKVRIHFLNGGDCDVTEALEGKTSFAKALYGGKPSNAESLRIQGNIMFEDIKTKSSQTLKIDTLRTSYDLSLPIKLNEDMNVDGKVSCFGREFYVHSGRFSFDASRSTKDVGHFAINFDGPAIVVQAYPVNPQTLEQAIEDDKKMKLEFLKNHKLKDGQGIRTSMSQQVIGFNSKQ